MSYNGNVYTSNWSSGSESYAITEYAGTASPVVGQLTWSSSAALGSPLSFKNYYAAGGALRTYVSFQSSDDSDSRLLQSCTLFPSGGITSATCSPVKEINFSTGVVDSSSNYLKNAYDVEVYNP